MMIYPSGIYTVYGKLLHIIYKKAAIKSTHIYIGGIKTRSVCSILCRLKKEELIVENAAGLLTITSKGLKVYIKLLKKIPIKRVSREEILSMFTLDSPPINVKTIADAFLPDESPVSAKASIRHLMGLMVAEGLLSKIQFQKGINYTLPGSVHVEKSSMSAIKTGYEKPATCYEDIKEFYTALPGTLTANDSGKKRYLY